MKIIAAIICLGALFSTLLIGCKEVSSGQVQERVGEASISGDKAEEYVLYISLRGADEAFIEGVKYDFDDLLKKIRDMKLPKRHEVILEIKSDQLSDLAYELAYEIEGLGVDRVWVVLTRI